MGDHQLAISGGLNGQLSDAQIYTGYTSLGRRLQYNVYGGAAAVLPVRRQHGRGPRQRHAVPADREHPAARARATWARPALYPFNRFTRMEFGVGVPNIDYQTFPFFRVIDIAGFATQFERGETRNLQSVNTLSPTMAFVTDNTIQGIIGPLSGRRVRAPVTPQCRHLAVGGLPAWMRAPTSRSSSTTSRSPPASRAASRSGAMKPCSRSGSGAPTWCAATTAATWASAAARSPAASPAPTTRPWAVAWRSPTPSCASRCCAAA